MEVLNGTDSPVQTIKDRLGIEEVISSYIKLEKAGVNLKARCPFHNEKTPSFFVSPGRESYYCFGCGAKGDIFTFVQEFEGLDFKGALKLLADRAGVILPKWNRQAGSDSSEKEKIYAIMEETAEYFSESLKNEKEALEYLKSRGVTEKTIKNFNIGFAKSGWNNIRDFFGKSFSDAELEKAGLVKKGEKGYYDRFRSRIMFPIYDSSGRVVAFSGRIFPPDGNGSSADVGAKYLNSPETPIFKKSSVLYGIDKAKDSIRKNDFSIVVEGQFDLLMSHQSGFHNTVATLGTAFSDKDRSDDGTVNNLGVIKRLSSNIVFVFDSDKAGFAAALRAAATALSFDMNVKGADTGEGFDPADLVLKKGADAWHEVIRNSKHIIEFLLDKFLSMPEKDPLKIKLLVDEKIVPYLVYVDNPVKKSHFISVISARSGIREEDIRQSIEKKEKERNVKEEKGNIQTDMGKQQIRSNKNILRKDHILRRLIGIILWQRSLKNPVLDTGEMMKKISYALGFSEEEIISETGESGLDLIFEAEAFYGGNHEENPSIMKDVSEMLLNLEEEHLKVELSENMLKLQQAENSKDKPKSEEILKNINVINNKIQKIKSGRF